ncbi:MAG: D-glycerate dehydrogenase [Alphaproteobacteria bacterium]|nr:D-glycerate dehydrogenase [Alphaproteobacteria bacterium]
MTTRPTILVTRKLPAAVEARASREFNAILNPDDRLIGADLAKRAEGCDGLLICSSEKITPELVKALPASVRAIATFSVGFEHIDLDACRARGIKVSHTPEVLNEAVADIAMLLLLGASRRASEGERMVRAGQWKGWYTTMLLGPQIGGKVLGIVGMGRIGRALARRARAFGMEIHYHNRSRLAAELEEGATYHATAESLLAASPFLSLHCPSTPESRNFLDARRIAHMPDGAVVVNTARGDIVDDEALIAALRSGKLFAAGLDVFAGEPNIHPGYAKLDNVFLLPHLGSATVETRDAMGFCALDNLAAMLGGRPAPNPLV